MRLTRPPLSYIPLLPVLSGIVAGVLCARFLPVGPWLMAGVAVASAFVGVLLRRSVLVEILLSAALGVAAVAISVPVSLDGAPGRDTVLGGVVTDVVQLSEHQRVMVDVGDACVRACRVQLTYPSFDPVLAPGDIISFSGTYSLPRRDTDIPLEDNLSEYYYNQGVSLLCYAPVGSLEVKGRSGNLLLAMKRWRARVADALLSSALDERTAIFIAAVLTGDSSAVSDECRRKYAAAGVAHILALSGAHVAVIAATVSLLLFPLVMAGHRRARWWLTIAVLWGYALFTGMSPSVCRAVIMATAVLLSLVLDRPRSSLNALCLAAAVILVFSPMSLMQAGFQLSFAATLSIILLTPRLAPVSLHRVRGYRVWVAAAATLAATAGTFPLMALHFHSVPVYFFIANMAAVAVMPVMIAGGLVFTSFLLVAGAEPAWIVAMLDGVYSLFDAVASAVAHLPGATVDNIYIDAWLVVPMYLALAFFAAYLYQRHRSYAVLAVATLLFTFGAASATEVRHADGEAYMLRSTDATSIAFHRGDTLRVLTTSPRHNHRYDSVKWCDRYRDYIATRGIRFVDIQPLDSQLMTADGTLRFGRRVMLVAHAADEGSAGSRNAMTKTDYCLVTAKWYGDPVELARRSGADTVVLSTEINSRRRKRYKMELEAAGVPVIDLGIRQLNSL